ncbi:MAG TPA: DNA/RNA non-specific endonuclease [Castellaniella sp.]|nr:DNA/RNA non-specific endonuclease [Castellaniella sp.]
MSRWIFLVLLVLYRPLPAHAFGCDRTFAGGQAPVLLNAKLAPRTTPLCYQAYAVLASGVTRGPLWSAEHLTAQGLANARATTRDGQFHEEDQLPPDDRATLADYVRSGFDRGHMAPSGDMPDPVAQQQSFSLANIVPQAPELNRGLWEGIERGVRRLAEREGDLYVVTGPAFQGQQVQSLKGRVLVPTATWKAIYDPVARGAGAYMCPNVSRPDCTTLSIAALSRTIGLDPFPWVPNAVKRTAMQLPAPEPSRYWSTGQRGRHSQQRQGLFDWLLK